MFRKDSKKDGAEIEAQDELNAIEQMLAANRTIFNDQAGTITYRTSRQIVERQESTRFTEIETKKTTKLKNNADDKNEQKNKTISKIFSKLNLSKSTSTTTDSKDKISVTNATTTTKTLKSSTSFKTTEETITSSSIQEQRPILNMPNLLSTSDSAFNLATNFKPTVIENTSINTNAKEHIDAIPVFVANAYNPLNSTAIFNQTTILTPQLNTPSSSTTNPPSEFSATTMPFSTSMADNTNEFLRQNSSVGNQTTTPGKPKSNLKPGLVYIFNHEQFDDDKTEFRIGSSVDVKSLCETFEGFKMKVEVHTDATLKKIRGIVRNIETKDFTNRSCLVVVILSHGHRFEKVSAKNTHYNIDDDILFPILRNHTLLNKPKIFFIQACKGSMEVGGFQRDAQPPNGAPAEILKCYSTFEGYVSYRTEDGSIFVQKLCENIKRDGFIKSIDEIMKDVTSAIKTITNEKQIPTITSTLTEPFVFGDYV